MITLTLVVFDYLLCNYDCIVIKHVILKHTNQAIICVHAPFVVVWYLTFRVYFCVDMSSLISDVV